METATITATPRVNETPDVYDGLLSSIRERYALATNERLFTTDATDLFKKFLDALPPEQRQTHTCNACRRFVDTYGGLVTISPEGKVASVMFDASGVPDLYRPAVAAMEIAVLRAKVNGVFLTNPPVWGIPKTGEWSHMAVKAMPEHLYKGTVIKTPEQVVAEKLQDYEMLNRGLAEFPLELCVKAQTLLTNGQLSRSEKHEGVAKWLVRLHQDRDAVKGSVAKSNVTWRAVASAPAGFCHVRSGMIGTLLEDLASDMDFDLLKRRFNEKMNPLQYMRPQAELSEGNRQQAEKIIGLLKTAGSLNRRFATLADIEALWKPSPRVQKGQDAGGVFGHLQTNKSKPKSDIISDVGVATTMTWDKFARTVLPDAAEIEYLVTDSSPFYAMVTAVDPSAPPILQWDLEERRNPVSWYTYPYGGTCSNWNLRAGAFVKVNAISYKPPMWTDPVKFKHHGNGVIFVLDGCQDKRANTAGAGIFPECLKSDYHSIRATIEHYSRSAKLGGVEEASANGVGAFQGPVWQNLTFRVTTNAGVQSRYKLDRWD